MSIPVLSNNTVVRNMQFRIKNVDVSAEPCFCETDNRWFICRTKANKLVKFGYNTSTVKVIIDMFELPPNTWPDGLIALKKTQG